MSLRPLKSDEFLPPISRWTTIGGLILIGAVGAAIALSAIVKYNVSVRAVATVRPSGDLRLVQAPMEGTIAAIQVSENQSVQQGDVIAQIDRSRLETQQSQLQTNIQQQQLQIGQLDAQLRLLQAQIAAESRAIDQSVAAAAAELNRNQRDYQNQQATTQADLTEAEATLEFARSEMQRYQQLVDSGAVSQLQLEEKQAAVQTAAAQVERARAALNPTEASVAIAQQQMAEAASRGRATLATLNREREGLEQNRLELQTQLQRDRQELQQIEAELQKTLIRATSDGMILRLNLRNPNQVVSMGETIAEIAPNRNNLVVKARVATQDINRVQSGQTAQLRIDACPYSDYGTLSGTVTAVSPDAIPTSDSAPNSSTPMTTSATTSDRYFEITIQPDQMGLTNGDRRCPLQAGMEAEANILSREESFLQLLLRRARLISNW
jgi:HlyD family secretion protein